MIEVFDRFSTHDVNGYCGFIANQFRMRINRLEFDLYILEELASHATYSQETSFTINYFHHGHNVLQFIVNPNAYNLHIQTSSDTEKNGGYA